MIAIDMEAMEAWWDRLPMDKVKKTNPNRNQFLSVTFYPHQSFVSLRFDLSWEPRHPSYKRTFGETKYPRAYSLCRCLFDAVNPLPPFAFLDLFLEAMEADGDMSFHRFLNEQPEGIPVA